MVITLKTAEQPRGHLTANQGIAVTAVVILTTSVGTVPFSPAREVTFPTSLARTPLGTTGSACSQPRHIGAMGVSTQSLRGRPLAVLSAEGKPTKCFIDTGSQVTLIKRTVLNRLDPDGKLRQRSSDKVLRGVSGTPMHPAAEVTLRYDLGQNTVEHPTLMADLDFPGDVLIGIDLLRSLNFTLRSKANSSHGELVLGDCQYPVVFTEARSLKISLLTTTCSIATQTGSQSEREAITTENPDLQQPLEGAEVLADANTLGKHCEDTDDDSEPEMEWDDFVEDTLEVNEWDIESLTLPPSVAIATCDAALSFEASGNECTPPELEHLMEHQRQQINKLLKKYHQLFDGGEEAVGLIPGVCHTIETGDARPVCIRQWRLPQTTREAIRQQCDTMLRSGVIEPSTSPWLSPVVLVKKKDGRVRFCVDYRGLNAVTRKDSYPLPRIDALLDELGPATVFTTLDARAAYWAVEVDPSDRPKTAFTDGYRLFHFCRLPFGLATAPSTFQRTMNVLLTSVLGRHTLCYLDDIVIYSSEFEQHLQDLEETLQLLKTAGLKLNMAKCKFAVATINFLGFTISPSGVLPNQEKVAAIVQTPPPRTVREVRRFLGCTGFFRKHIPGYANITAPLHLILKKTQKWIWGPEQQAAFEELKQKLTSAPVLKQPDFDREFELHTDASSIAIGACLMQRADDNSPHAIAYYSRKLRDAETRYPAIDLEALSVVEGVRVFNSYLYGRHFIIYTDHRPLVHVFSKKTKSPRMTRFAHELSFLTFSIRYKEGPTNHVPDLLSRHVATLEEEQMLVTSTFKITDLLPEALAKQQLEDPQLIDLRRYLIDGVVPKKKLPLTLEEFEVKEGVIYRMRHLLDQTLYQLVVPASLKNSALKAAHLPPLASHPGIHRTYENAKSMFYWVNMFSDCKEYVEHCQVCQQMRGNPQAVPMGGAPLAEAPLERVSMDIFDLGQSIPVRYGLSIIDQHSRYLQVVPLRTVTATTVHRAFVDHWVTLFGPPRAIQTDNGSQFTSHLFNELCRMMRVSHHYTIRYHPQANGLVERTNWVIKSALTSLVSQRPRIWHQFVPELRLQVNSAIHRSTQEQPLYLVTGRHANFPVGLTNQVVFAENISLKERLQEARKAAVIASKRAREIYGKYYNRGKRENFIPDRGSLVWYFDHGRHTPLTGRWKGPARIITQLGPLAFEIRDIHTDVQRRAQLNHLKPFKSSAELSYSSEECDADVEDSDEFSEPEVPVSSSSLRSGRGAANPGAPLSLEPCHRTPGEPSSEDEML